MSRFFFTSLVWEKIKKLDILYMPNKVTISVKLQLTKRCSGMELSVWR